MQIIIIFDENTKENLNFIKKISKIDKRIELLVNKKNIGAGYSRNRGIKHAAGKYIAFIDSDDIWNKYKLETQIKFMKKNNYPASHTSYKIINSKNKLISVRYAKTLNYKNLLLSCDIGLSTVVVTKKLLNNFKKPFPNIKTKEDFVLWLKITKKGYKFYSINNVLSSWTIIQIHYLNHLSKNKRCFQSLFLFSKFQFLKIYLFYIYFVNKFPN